MTSRLIRTFVSCLIVGGLMVAGIGTVGAQVLLEPVVTSDMPDPLTDENFTGLSSQPSLGPAGMAFRATSCTDETCDTQVSSIYRMSGGSLEMLANGLTPIPGRTETFLTFSDPVQSGSDVVFQASASLNCPPGPCGVYTIKDGVLGAVAESGSTTPTGGTYVRAQMPDMEGGILVLHANVDNGGPPFDWEIHADFGEGLEVIVDADTLVPGTSETFYSVGAPTTGGGRIVFAGMRQDYTNALYQYKDGVLTTLVDETTPIPGETWNIVDAISPSLVGNVLTFQGRTSDFEDSLFADFGDGIVRIITSLVDTIPGTGDLVNWIYTPAVSGETLVFNVEDILYDAHLMFYREGQLSRVLGTGSMLDGKTVGYYMATGADSGYQGTFVFHVTFEGFPTPLAIYALRYVDLDDLSVMDAMPDTSGDGQPEVATVVPDFETFTSTVHITNPVTGGTVAEIDFDYGQAVGMAVLPDFAKDPSDEMALLLSRDTEAPMTQTRDCLTGAWIRNQKFFDANWTVEDMVSLSDINASGFPEVGVLGRKPSDGQIAVQLRDGATGNFIRNLFFFGENAADWRPLKAVVIPNMTGSPTGSPEVGVLARKPSTGRIGVQIKDAGQNAGWFRNVFFLNSNWTPEDLVVLPNVDGNPGPEVALLATNNVTGKIVVSLKDAGTNNFIHNHFHLGSNWTPVALTEVADMGLSPASEATVLGVNKLNGVIMAQSRDTAKPPTGDFVANVKTLNATWRPLGFATIGNLDAVDGDEIAILAIRITDGKIVVKTIDSKDGNVMSDAFLN